MKRTSIGLIALISFASFANFPFTPRDAGSNIVPNAEVDGLDRWYVPRTNIYDPMVSKTNDGSGSFKLVTPIVDGNSPYDWFVTRTIIVEPEKQYTVSAYMYSDTFPSPLPGMFLSFRGADGQFISNSHSSMQSVTKSHEWQEVTSHFRPPVGAKYAQIKGLLTRQHHEYPGTVWLDEFYIGEGINFDNPPSSKDPFDGAHTKVDTLGNLEVKRDGAWQQFIPLCIHADNRRPDWSFYSEQGFNCNMWAGSSLYIQKAKEAVSEFNPHGMMSGFQIANFIIPGHRDYNNLALLDERIQDIIDAELHESLLLYYWDNENDETSEWDVPMAVSNTIKGYNTGHPIYMLMGNEGLTRKYKNEQTNMIDLTGDYINVHRYRDTNGFVTVNNIEGQKAPLTFAQINYGTGLKFRARIYAGLAKGARGFSIWRDDYLQAGTQAGPIENTPWWNELPQIRRELDKLKPLIKESHWTRWGIALSSDKLDAGMREHRNNAYIILSNEHDYPVQSEVTVSGLLYEPGFAVNHLTEQVAATVSNIQNGFFNRTSTFTITLPAYGALVLKLLPEEDVLAPCCDNPDPMPISEF